MLQFLFNFNKAAVSWFHRDSWPVHGHSERIRRVLQLAPWEPGRGGRAPWSARTGAPGVAVASLAVRRSGPFFLL